SRRRAFVGRIALACPESTARLISGPDQSGEWPNTHLDAGFPFLRIASHIWLHQLTACPGRVSSFLDARDGRHNIRTESPSPDLFAACCGPPNRGLSAHR